MHGGASTDYFRLSAFVKTRGWPMVKTLCDYPSRKAPEKSHAIFNLKFKARSSMHNRAKDKLRARVRAPARWECFSALGRSGRGEIIKAQEEIP
jgi:hypothetical protein